MQHLDNRLLKSHTTHTEDLSMTYTEAILSGEIPGTPYARLMQQAHDFGSRGLDALQAGRQSDALELFACQTRLFDTAREIANDIPTNSTVGLAAKWAMA